MSGFAAAPVEFNSAGAVPSSTERPVLIKPDEPRDTIHVVKDQSSLQGDDEIRKLLFAEIPLEDAPVPEPELIEPSQSVSDLLLSKLDEMKVSLEQAVEISHEQQAIVARVAALTGATLSVGFITWALRSGTLLASCLATMPAWRNFDPLPVLKVRASERERQREKADADGQEETTKFSRLKTLLDPERPVSSKSWWRSTR